MRGVLLNRGTARVVRKKPENVGQMLELARQGDSAAWVRLVRKYREYLKLLAQREINKRLKDIRSKEDPSDVVQEALFKAYKHFGKFRGSSEEELIAWLRCILARCIATLVRRYFGTQKRDRRLEQELEVGLEESSRLVDRFGGSQSTPSQQAQRREKAVVVANALAKLKGHYRQVLVLRHIDGLSFAEVAERMGRSVKSVQNIWARALVRMREALESEPVKS